MCCSSHAGGRVKSGENGFARRRGGSGAAQPVAFYPGIALFAWHSTTGSVALYPVTDALSESFYWLTITFSQTLGTALGDWVADSSLGYGGLR